MSASAGELPAQRGPPAAQQPTRLPDGRLAAAWLDDGEAETAAIRLAIRDHQGWREVGRSPPESTAAAAFMHARSLGRPILWAEGGWLHLWYEAYPLGPGAGASVLHSVSTDGGRSWQQTRRLEAGPFGGLGARLGETPRPLADGGVLLPLAPHGGREGPWLRLAATGQLIGLMRQLPAAGRRRCPHHEPGRRLRPARHGLLFGALAALLPLGQFRNRVALAATTLALVTGIAPIMLAVFRPALGDAARPRRVATGRPPASPLHRGPASPCSARPAVCSYRLAPGLAASCTPSATSPGPCSLPCWRSAWLGWKRQTTWLLILALDLLAYAGGLFANLWSALIDPLLVLLAALVAVRGWVLPFIASRRR